jgi:hypothetical protein
MKKKSKQKQRAVAPLIRPLPGKKMPVTVRDPLSRRIVKRS